MENHWNNVGDDSTIDMFDEFLAENKNVIPKPYDTNNH